MYSLFLANFKMHICSWVDIFNEDTAVFWPFFPARPLFIDRRRPSELRANQGLTCDQGAYSCKSNHFSFGFYGVHGNTGKWKGQPLLVLACRNPLLYRNSHVSPCEAYQIGMIEVRHLHVVRGDAKDSASMLRRYRTIVLHPQDFYILLFWLFSSPEHTGCSNWHSETSLGTMHFVIDVTTKGSLQFVQSPLRRPPRGFSVLYNGACLAVKRASAPSFLPPW